MRHFRYPIHLSRGLAAWVGVLLLCAVARAGIATENFESFPVSDPSSLTSLSIAGGFATLSISDPTDPQAFGIQDLSALQIAGSAALGSRTVQPDLYDDPTPLNVDFSQPVTAFSMDFADASDQVDLLSLKAFSGPDGTGNVIAAQTGTLTSALNQFALQTLTVSGQGIESVQFVGGPAGTDQAFYDNFSITTAGSSTGTGGGGGSVAAVPLPPAAELFPLGLAMACLSGWLIKRSNRQVHSRIANGS